MASDVLKVKDVKWIFYKHRPFDLASDAVSLQCKVEFDNDQTWGFSRVVHISDLELMIKDVNARVNNLGGDLNE